MPEETKDFIHIPLWEGEVKTCRVTDFNGKLPNGIRAKVCQIMSGEWKTKSFMFDKAKGWDMDKAKKWMSWHKGSFTYDKLKKGEKKMSEKHKGELTEWSQKYINDLPNSAFALVKSSVKNKADDRALPFKDIDGKIDLLHLRNALARLPLVKGFSRDKKNRAKKLLERILDRVSGKGAAAMTDEKDTGMFAEDKVEYLKTKIDEMKQLIKQLESAESLEDAQKVIPSLEGFVQDVEVEVLPIDTADDDKDKDKDKPEDKKDAETDNKDETGDDKKDTDTDENKDKDKKEELGEDKDKPEDKGSDAGADNKDDDKGATGKTESGTDATDNTDSQDTDNPAGSAQATDIDPETLAKEIKSLEIAHGKLTEANNIIKHKDRIISQKDKEISTLTDTVSELKTKNTELEKEIGVYVKKEEEEKQNEVALFTERYIKLMEVPEQDTDNVRRELATFSDTAREIIGRQLDQIQGAQSNMPVNDTRHSSELGTYTDPGQSTNVAGNSPNIQGQGNSGQGQQVTREQKMDELFNKIRVRSELDRGTIQITG